MTVLQRRHKPKRESDVYVENLYEDKNQQPKKWQVGLISFKRLIKGV